MPEIVCLEQMNNKEKLFKDLLYALTLSGKIFGTLIAGVILGLYLDSILPVSYTHLLENLFTFYIERQFHNGVILTFKELG